MSGAIIAMCLCDPAALDAVQRIVGTIAAYWEWIIIKVLPRQTTHVHHLAQSNKYVSALVSERRVDE